MKKVGAQRPIKIPNLSACARASGPASPFAMNHTAIDAMIERNPKIKQMLDNEFDLILCNIKFSPSAYKRPSTELLRKTILSRNSRDELASPSRMSPFDMLDFVRIEWRRDEEEAIQRRGDNPDT